MSVRRDIQMHARPFADVLAEALAVLRQDAAEYAYIAVIGAVMASVVVLVPGIIGGPIALSLIGPLLALVAIGTFATCAAAFGCVSNHLQPDAAAAFAAMARRSVALLRPWLLLLAMLWVAGLGAAWGARYMGPVPPVTLLLPIAAVAWLYVLPRSLCVPMVLGDDAPGRRVEAVSGAIVRALPRTFSLAWGAALVPALLVMPLGLAGGFDAVFGAVVAFIFVGTMPVAAALMSLLYFDAASRLESIAAHPAPVRPSDDRLEPRRAH
jgi:hypothetical protein